MGSSTDGDTDSGKEEEPRAPATCWVLSWLLSAITHSLVPTTLQSRSSSHHAEEETGSEVKELVKGCRREARGYLGRSADEKRRAGTYRQED